MTDVKVGDIITIKKWDRPRKAEVTKIGNKYIWVKYKRRDGLYTEIVRTRKELGLCK